MLITGGFTARVNPRTICTAMPGLLSPSGSVWSKVRPEFEPGWLDGDFTVEHRPSKVGCPLEPSNSQLGW